MRFVQMSEKRFDFPVRNVTDIIIKDLQGNYYNINMLYSNGNDEIIIEIKKPDEEYRNEKGEVV